VLIAEALDTLITLGWWALGWITVLAAALTIVLLTSCAVGAWAVRGLWRTAVRPAWARSRTTARRIARRTRRTDYREAA
jgi:hypothetical protein